MDVKKIAVIGGSGQMGQGICHVAALGGIDVVLMGRTTQTCDKALVAITKGLNKGVEKGKLSSEQVQVALAHLTVTTSIEEAGRDADFVIEAVPEELKVKQETFLVMESICRPDTIFATNTSSLSITEIFSVLKRTDRCIGMHFFIPVHVMKLVEIVNGLETSLETTTITQAVAQQMGKETVLVNEAPGFATSRINALIGNEAFRMLQEGVASASDIDKAIKLGLNHPMGPFEMIDMVGLDTRLHTMQYLASTLGERFMPNPLHVKYVKAGRLGRKVGKGVYDYIVKKD